MASARSDLNFNVAHGRQRRIVELGENSVELSILPAGIQEISFLKIIAIKLIYF